jgi:capsular polysaccharide transport system permease protein
VLIIGGRVMGAISANIALLTFPLVKTFDVIVGRALLELATLSVVAVAFVVGLYVVNGVWVPADLPTTLAGYGAALLLGVSIGCFNAVFSRLVPFWERVWSLLSLPVLFLSAVFYLPSSLPTEILNILWYNPVLHVVEWVRSGVYISYEPYLSTSYVLWISATLLLLTLVLNKFFARQMLDR